MKFFIYIFYRYYNEGHDKPIAYEKAISTPHFIACLYLVGIGLLMNLKVSINQCLVLLLVYFIAAVSLTIYFVRRKDINDIELKNRYHKVYGVLAVLYVVLSLMFFGIAANVAHQRKIDLLNEKKQKGIYDINY